MTRNAWLVVGCCLAACGAPETGDDGGSQPRDAGRVGLDAGPADDFCPELDALQEQTLHPQGTLTASNIQSIIERRFLPPSPLVNLASMAGRADAGACTTGPSITCTCTGGGTVVVDTKQTAGLTEQRAVAFDCIESGWRWAGRSCQRTTVQAPNTIAFENYQYSQTRLDGGTSYTFDTQYFIKQAGNALVELPRQRLTVSDGSVTLQYDPNVAGPEKIIDRQGTWNCGAWNTSTGMCTGPGATIPWSR